MTDSLKHIGLQVSTDYSEFYFEILNCKFEKSFIFNNRDALLIFGIDAPVKVIFAFFENTKLELFILDKINMATFNHICIETPNANDISIRAKEKGYRVHSHQKNENFTHFIHDSNNNIFEFKTR